VNRIKAQITDRTIKSPINGIVTEIHKQLGENVTNSEPQYATVVRINELKVRFYLDAATLKRSLVGDHVNVYVGRDRTQLAGTIIFVSPIIDPDSGLGRLEIKLSNQNFNIQSGVACHVSLPRDNLAEFLLPPSSKSTDHLDQPCLQHQTHRQRPIPQLAKSRCTRN